MPYATVTVTGKILRGGVPASGRAFLVPSVSSISDLSGNVVLYGPLEGDLDSQGVFSIVAPATDDPNLTPSFGYSLKFELDEGALPTIENFGLPTSLVTIDVTDLYSAQGYYESGTYTPVLVGATGPPGPQGAPGNTGPTGPANTLTIGTVTEGGVAAATITGAAPNQVLNLVLPEGPQGIQGIQGPPGTGSVDSVNGYPGPAVVLDAADVGAAPAVHTHDDRYFTETEVNTALAGKSDTTHNHDAAYSAAAHNHDAAYVNVSGDTMTGRLTTKSIRETLLDKGSVASGTITFNLDDGTVQYATLTGAVTVAFSNDASGDSLLMRLYMASVVSVTWPAGIRWRDGTAPTLAVGYNLITFWREGTVWYGAYAGVFS